jgi:hypothetical protein
MRTIALQIVGEESAPVEIGITRDVIALDILTPVGLEECELFHKSKPQKYFQRGEAARYANTEEVRSPAQPYSRNI